MPTSPTRPAVRAGLSMRSMALVAVGVSVLALLGGWAWGHGDAGLPAAGGAVSGDRAEVIVRRTEVAFADAQAAWRRALAGYEPAALVFFTGSSPTACAGGATVSGPFYCPENGTASFDLGFLDALGARLQRQRDLGIAVVAVRLSAEHLQRETGLLDSAALRLIGATRSRRHQIDDALSLQADCLTGAWAADAAATIGPVPEPFYGDLVLSWRNVTADLRRAGIRVPPEFDPFSPAAPEAHAAAFAQGYAAAAPGGCPAPPDLAAAG